MINNTKCQDIKEFVLEKVKDENITLLRIDRYDGFLFDDFEISKFWSFSKQYEVASSFSQETLNYIKGFKYSLLFTNEYQILFFRVYNTLEQVFKDPENINRVCAEYIEEGFKKSLITFKQYNAYMKNHGGILI